MFGSLATQRLLPLLRNNRPGHRPFLWVMASFSSGIVIHEYRHFDFGTLAVLALICLAGIGISQRYKNFAPVVLPGIFILLGIISAHGRGVYGQDHILYRSLKWGEGPVTVSGVIVSDIRKTQQLYSQKVRFELAVRAAEVKGQWQRCSGKILVNVSRYEPLHYGDEIVASGNLHFPYHFSNNDKFSYRTYLKRKGIPLLLSVKKTAPLEVLRTGQGHPVMGGLLRLRERGNKILSGALNPPEAAIMQAVLLGERSYIPRDLNDLFVKTGTAHILAISGLNVGVVVAVFFLALRMLPVKHTRQYHLTMIFALGYMLVTGASASVVRATLMVIVFLGGFVLERETDSVNSLAFAAFLILATDPMGFFDIGFQLSFVSVLFILILYPRLLERCSSLTDRFPQKFFRYAVESFVLSLTACLGVAGLIAYYFEIVTPLTVVANLFVVPLSTAANILGIGLLLAGLVSPWLAALFAVCLKFTLNLMVLVMFYGSQVPGACFYLKNTALWHIGIYYAALAVVVVFLRAPSIDKAG